MAERARRRWRVGLGVVGVLVVLLSQAGGAPAAAIDWRPAALSALGDAARAMPVTPQRITQTPTGGLKIQLVELSPPESKAGVRPALATIVDACGAPWSVRLEIATFVTAMINDARRASVSICLRSAYRSYGEQVAIRLDLGCAAYPEPTRSACVYDWTASEVVAAGMGRSARPGYSRHQQGIALDVANLRAGNALGDWVTANAHHYGFYRFADFQMLGPTGPWGDDQEHISLDAG